jgi:MFS family permease
VTSAPAATGTGPGSAGGEIVEEERAEGAGATSAARLGRGFAWLWTGETVSLLGTTITTVALPALAVLRLGAGPVEVGLLAAASRLPFPFLGLIAGVAADRLPRRTIMVICDIARILVLGAIPVADALGHMSVGLLVGVALVSGVFGVFFDICNLAYVPSLVGRHGLVRAYSWLEVTNAVSILVGPGLGGLLVQAFGAARAVAADAVSFLVSAVCIIAIPTVARPCRDRPEQEATDRPSALADLREGLQFVFGEPVLRSLLLAQGMLVLGSHSVSAPMVLFAYNRLGLTPGTLGLVFSIAGIGAVVGAAISRRNERWRPGTTLIVTGLIIGVCICLLPIAAVMTPLVVLPVVLVVESGAGTLGNVTQVILRQSRTPERIQGRMNALFRVVYWGVWPLGNILGGLLAAVSGPVTALVVGGAVVLGSSALASVTPLRHATRDMPTGAARPR